MTEDTSSNGPDEQGKSTEKVSIFRELKRRKVYRVAVTYLVVGWFIVQIANATFADFGIPIWAYRFVVLMLALGFPVAIILAWAFELTPDGIRTTMAAREEQSESEYHPEHHQKRNWMAYGVGALLPTVIFGTLAIIFYIRSPSVEVIDKSIAVLPFENRSNIEEDRYFTDGIHDDLLTHISRIGSIKTISRTSVMQYRDNRPNIKQIGEELGVATILEGGVQRAGDQIRINVQLIDATIDEHIWAEIYTREMTADNIFNIQNEIAVAIARQLQVVLSPDKLEVINELPTNNLEALESYFRGKEQYHTITSSGLLAAIEHFGNAVRLDPEFALAHAFLASAHMGLIYHGGADVIEQTTKARPHITRALELDPNLSAGYVVLARLEGMLGNSDKAEDAFKMAIQYEPNSSNAHNLYGIFLMWTRHDFDKARSHFEKQRELDPKAPINANYATTLIELGDVDKGLSLLRQAVAENPQNTITLGFLANYYWMSEYRLDLAIKYMREAIAIDPNVPNQIMMLSRQYLLLGDDDANRFWIKFALDISPESYLAAIFEGLLLFSEGKESEAIEKWRLVQRDTPHYWGCIERICTSAWNAGNPERIFMVVADAHPELTQPGPTVSKTNLYAAIHLFRCARELLGKRDLADALKPQIEQVFSNSKRKGWFGYEYSDAEYYVILGEHDKALDAIREWIAGGGCAQIFLNNPYLESLESYPEYRQFKTIVSDRLSEQRANLAQMEANGELAPIPPL